MTHSLNSDSLLLPFGSLMGAVPVDSLQHDRVLGAFGQVLHSSKQPAAIQQQIHSVIDPFPLVSRDRRPSTRAGAAVSD